jgi:hypothetical protein
MMRSARFGRYSGLCCLLAALVAATPALPCLLLCASHAHMEHSSSPGSHPCTGHQVPAPLASVVSTLAAIAMIPSSPTLAPASPAPRRVAQAPRVETTSPLDTPPEFPPPRST